MGIAQWGGIAGASVALLGLVVGANWWVALRYIEAIKARFDAEAQSKIADAETRVAKAESEAAVVKANVAQQILDETRHRTLTAGSPFTGVQLLRQEIEDEIRYVMQQLSATKSSVLVKDPDPGSEYLFFLAAHGPK